MANVVQMSHQIVTGVFHGSKPIQTPENYQTPTLQGRVAELVVYNLPYGGVSSYPSQSAVTSTTGHSERTRSRPSKKQISSTSRSYYSRRRYYYGKKRKY